MHGETKKTVQLVSRIIQLI